MKMPRTTLNAIPTMPLNNNTTSSTKTRKYLIRNASYTTIIPPYQALLCYPRFGGIVTLCSFSEIAYDTAQLSVVFTCTKDFHAFDHGTISPDPRNEKPPL